MRQFFIFLILINIPFIISCASHKTPETNKLPLELQAGISGFRIDEYYLNVSKLPRLSKQEGDSLIYDSKLEKYSLPRKPAWDRFKFDILYEKSKGMLWIVRENDFSGTTEVFGPLKISSNH